jgi:GxxExxY protein
MSDYTKNVNEKYLHSEITGKILQGFYLVSNKIGYGFDIEIFKKALSIELEFLGLKCELNKFKKLRYKNIEIGEFKIDIFVAEKINVMIISEIDILQRHKIKLSNQLKNSNIEVGLLLNVYFESSHNRIFYSNNLKEKN